MVGLQAKPVVELGIDVLAGNQFKGLEGKRLGLITNQTGVNAAGVSTIDVLRANKDLNLVALFAPEHGLYGAEAAGDDVATIVDPRTNLPVYSLFGSTRKPTQEMLKNIDVLIYDLQDIGCRSYTYISTLGLAMEAAGEAKKEFYVLDRPNPLSGNRVEGMPLDPKYRSFVGEWEVPFVHGLTVGELAYMIHGENWINNRPKLTVVPMRGWTRSMHWPDTGLWWVPTSPHIPTVESAYNYPTTGLIGDVVLINNGVGYTLPFSLVGAPGVDAYSLTASLNARNLAGFFFRPCSYRPFYTPAEGKLMCGVQIYYANIADTNLCNCAMFLLEEFRHRLGPDIFDKMSADQSSMFVKECGGPTIMEHFRAGKPASEIIQSWEPYLQDFRSHRAKYLLYK